VTYLPIDQMLKDAEALARQPSDGRNQIRDTLTADVACHVKALASEYIRVQGLVLRRVQLMRYEADECERNGFIGDANFWREEAKKLRDEV